MDFQPSVFFDALTSQGFIETFRLTIILTVVSMVTGVFLGLLVALASGSGNRVLRWLAKTYTWIFRAIPLLVLLFVIWYALPQLVPAFKDPWFSPFLAAWVALSVNEGAYSAEIMRGGLLSIDEGQRLAARALGMSPFKVFTKVMAPQLTRVIIPPVMNDFITMLKLTALASTISLRELFAYTEQQVASTFRFAEFYFAAAVYYLVFVSILTVIQGWVERRFMWTSRQETAPSALSRVGLAFARR